MGLGATPKQAENHQLPFQEVDGFLLVEAPAPSPGACKTLWVTLAQSSGYAIENRLLEWVCSQKINGQKPNSKPDKNLVKCIRPIELGHDKQQLRAVVCHVLFVFSAPVMHQKRVFIAYLVEGKIFRKARTKIAFSMPCI